MVQLVNEYSNYVFGIKDLIKKSPFKTSYFFEKLNLTKTTFYRKLNSADFNAKEVQLITEILFPKESALTQIKKENKISLKQIEKGKTKDLETITKKMRQQFL